ncbi:HPF/RaiA family ribosome-associated protein [Desulfobulbus sp. F1]|jgi:cold shock CspA family protein/ribosome-associated translation inhibitor RaiA|nr:HPF/RaiA family ribosome-associated protein [Desulfobulbus sp. F1]
MDLKVETRNLDMRAGWQEKIEEEREKLIRHYANLVLHLRVSIEATPGYKEGGYEVSLVASVPNDTVVVKRWGEKVHTLLVETFDVLGLQLKDIVRKKHNHKHEASVKVLGGAPGGDTRGTVQRVFDEYGFIMTLDNQEVFFHAKALKDMSMNDLAEGAAVSLALEEGEKGLQAAWVKVAA